MLAVDDKEEATKIAENVRQHFPHLPILARARDRQHYWELRKLGCAQRVPRDVRLGVRDRHRGAASRSATARTRRTGSRASGASTRRATLEELGELWGTDDYFERAKRAMDEAERLMREEDPNVYVERDAAWDNETLRADRQVDAAARDQADSS